MNFKDEMKLSSKELEQFKKVCNHLLSETFLLRSQFQGEKGRSNNPDYYFLTAHFDLVSDYLSLLDWNLYHEAHYGYFYVENNQGMNRVKFNKEQTATLLMARLIFEEKSDEIGLENDVIITVRELRNRMIDEFGVSKNFGKQKIQSDLNYFVNFHIFQKISGSLGDADSTIAIMPTILTVVSNEKIQQLVKQMESEELDEEIDENPTGELALLP